MLSTAFFGGVVILASVLTAIAGLVVARRRIPLPVRERHTTAIGTIYAAVYVLFGLVAGFSLFSVWQEFQTAQKTTETEASSVETIYRLGGGFPEPVRAQVQQLAESYARAAVEEWPLLEQAQSSPHADTLLDELRRAAQDIEPATEAQGALRMQALEELNELEEARVLRLVLARKGLPYILWVVLVVGGILTVAFPYLLGIDAAWLHTATVVGLTVLVALILCVIGILDYPIGGGVGVQPESFEVVLREIGGNGGGP